MMFYDTHAHYDDERFDGTRDDIISTLPSNGIDLVVNVGASLDGTEKSIGLAEKYHHVYCSAGIHPDGADDPAPLSDRMDILREYLKHPKCVALGEIGLDYYYGKDTREKQRELFKAQMEIAANNFTNAIISAGNEVNTAMLKVRSAEELREMIDKQVEAQETAYNATKKLFAGSSANYLNVITAHNNLIQAQMTQISNRMEAISATVELYLALGGGAE